jgi:hypothetical protein
MKRLSQRTAILFKCLLLMGLTYLTPNELLSQPLQKISAFSFFRNNNKVFTEKDIKYENPSFFLFVDPECEHCQRAIRNFSNYSKDFKTSNIYIVSVSLPGRVATFLRRYAPELVNKNNVLLLHDKQNNFINIFKPLKYPGMFLYNRQGELVMYQDDPDMVFRFDVVFKKLK